MVRGMGYLRGAADLERADRASREGRAGTTIATSRASSSAPDERRGVAELNGEGEVVGGIVVARYGTHALRRDHNVKQRIKEIATGLPEGVQYRTPSTTART